MKDRYLELVQQFPLRPIRSKAEYKRALRIVDGFAVVSEGTLNVEEQDYFETLVLLVESYELKNEHVEISSVDPIEVLKHLMEEHEMKSADLGKLIGSKGVASEILNGKRELSKSQIIKLAERFSVDVGVFFPMRRANGRSSSRGARSKVTQ